MAAIPLYEPACLSLSLSTVINCEVNDQDVAHWARNCASIPRHGLLIRYDCHDGFNQFPIGRYWNPGLVTPSGSLPQYVDKHPPDVWPKEPAHGATNGRSVDPQCPWGAGLRRLTSTPLACRKAGRAEGGEGGNGGGDLETQFGAQKYHSVGRCSCVCTGCEVDTFCSGVTISKV